MSARGFVLVLVIVACGPVVLPSGVETSGSGSSGSTSEGGTAASLTTSTATTTGSSTTAATDDSSTTAVELDSSSSSAQTDATESTGSVCPDLPDCWGSVYECADAMDNDGDGLTDLADPDCFSTCDDSEAIFGAEWFYEEAGCNQECYFDGTSGPGDDGCIWQADCDPLDPGADWGCGYSPNPQCQEPVFVPESCLDICQPLVPNGCDCFGCCTFFTPEGPADLHLFGWNDCSAADLSGCAPCTQHLEACGNPCDVDACEVCIGQTSPAPGCAAPACVGGVACSSSCDCGPGEGCITGCCILMPAARQQNRASQARAAHSRGAASRDASASPSRTTFPPGRWNVIAPP